jgi:hypothetical protein
VAAREARGRVVCCGAAAGRLRKSIFILTLTIAASLASASGRVHPAFKDFKKSLCEKANTAYLHNVV